MYIIFGTLLIAFNSMCAGILVAKHATENPRWRLALAVQCLLGIVVFVSYIKGW